MLRIYYLKVSDYDGVPEVEISKKVSEETRELTKVYRNEKVRRLKWLGEAMIRNLMEMEWQLQQGDYRISKAEHGKPYIQGTAFPVFYNLSHSGDYLVCGLSDREVGIDIQQIGKYRPEVVRRFFHPHEIKNLETCEEELRTDLFFRYWSAKESFLKYTGTGLSASLSGFEIWFEGQDIRILKPDFQPKVYIQECPIHEDYKCFVCSGYSHVPKVSQFVFADL